MTTATEERPVTAVKPQQRLPFAALAVTLASVGMVWPGGRSALVDQFYTLTILALIYFAVARHAGFKELVSHAPEAAKWGVKIVLGALLVGQLWGVSAHTFPIASWTMYAAHPGDEAAVFRFDAVTADGESVAFTPSASNPTLPAKMALVHLRRLSDRVYVASIGTDAEQLEAAQDKLRRAIVTYVDIHNEQLSDPQSLRVEISRVTYDITQDQVTIDSGDRTVLMQFDVEPS